MVQLGDRVDELSTLENHPASVSEIQDSPASFALNADPLSVSARNRHRLWMRTRLVGDTRRKCEPPAVWCLPVVPGVVVGR